MRDSLRFFCVAWAIPVTDRKKETRQHVQSTDLKLRSAPEYPLAGKARRDKGCTDLEI